MQTIVSNADEDNSESVLLKRQLALSEEILAHFNSYSQSDSNAQCIVVLDPALRDATTYAEFAACLSALKAPLNKKDLPRVLWSHKNLKPEHRPYLVPLDLTDPAGQRLLDFSMRMAIEDQDIASLAHGSGQRVCGWIFTHENIKTLATHLGQIAIQRLPAGLARKSGKSMLLRYYDPNVMPLLWALSDTAQREALLGPITQWSLLDRVAKLRVYKSEQNENTQRVPLSFSAQQWMALQSIGGLNQACFQWQEKNADGLPPPNQKIQDGLHALVRAQSYGIDDDKDLKAFAWHSLTVHPRFYEHPIVKRALTRLPEEKYYTATVADISEQSWQQIQRESSNR